MLRRTVPIAMLLLFGCAQSGSSKAPSLTKAPSPVVAVVPLAPGATAAPDSPRREPFEEDLFGIHLVDDYRWMEKPKNAAELTGWLSQQGDEARRHLEAIGGRNKLRERARELGMALTTVTDVQPVGDLLFYFKTERGAELRKLVVRGKDRRERVLVDPTAMRTADGKHVSIDHYRASHDGKLVAYGLAEGGGEIATEHILETGTARELPDVIPRIWGEFAVAWRADSKSFYYTQMAKEEDAPGGDRMKNMRALLHRLGDPVDRDVVVLGPGSATGPRLRPEQFPLMVTFPGSHWVVGRGANAGGRQPFIAREKALPAANATSKSPWNNIGDYADLIKEWAVHGDDLYLLTGSGAPNRRIVRLLAGKPRLADAAVVLPEGGEDVIENIVADAKWLYLHINHNGRSRLRRLSFAGGKTEDLPLPFDGWIQDLRSDPRREGVMVQIQSWTREDGFFAFEPKARTWTDLALSEPATIDFTGIVADEVEVKTADGTLVPLTILHRKDLVKDGSHPTVLQGYGAYGISSIPNFRPFYLAWLERGGVHAVAHIRGGGEKGEAWRQAGKGVNKPNSIQDFIACGEYLVRDKFTSPSHLGAFGVSFGGIVVGRAITERPELFGAAMIWAGELNPLRYLEGQNGANQSSELGTPDTEAGVRSLHAADSFHNIRQGVKYPPVMLFTGLNDSRVPTWMSAKFAARLRSVSAAPVLLRIEKDEGHGVGSTRRQRFDFFSDMWSFFLEQMGDPEFRAQKPMATIRPAR